MSSEQLKHYHVSERNYNDRISYTISFGFRTGWGKEGLTRAIVWFSYSYSVEWGLRVEQDCKLFLKELDAEDSFAFISFFSEVKNVSLNKNQIGLELVNFLKNTNQEHYLMLEDMYKKSKNKNSLVNIGSFGDFGYSQERYMRGYEHSSSQKNKIEIEKEQVRHKKKIDSPPPFHSKANRKKEESSSMLLQEKRKDRKVSRSPSIQESKVRRRDDSSSVSRERSKKRRNRSRSRDSSAEKRREDAMLQRLMTMMDMKLAKFANPQSSQPNPPSSQPENLSSKKKVRKTNVSELRKAEEKYELNEQQDKGFFYPNLLNQAFADQEPEDNVDMIDKEVSKSKFVEFEAEESEGDESLKRKRLRHIKKNKDSMDETLEDK